MDWFERITGFPERNYSETQARLSVADGKLTSSANGRAFGIGSLELVSLRELRRRLTTVGAPRGKLEVETVQADVRRLHHDHAHRDALFQVASQFNLLEMIGPHVTPEDGVGIYEMDKTQGPACAIAAGAATIYRNYFVPFADGFGQTADRQLNGLKALGNSLSGRTSLPVADLWDMSNGYALCTKHGLAGIDRYLEQADSAAIDELRADLAVGLHWDVEVTDAPGDSRPSVSQAFCSALPVAYSDVRGSHWRRFAELVLEGAYEATLLAAALNARRGASNRVFLTSLGGGAFGNADSWIEAGISRALELAATWGLSVILVSYSRPPHFLNRIAATYS